MLIKRSFSLSGHRTSVALEPAFWDVLATIAHGRDMPVAALVAEIDSDRAATQPLASALRVFALQNRP